MPMSDRTPDVHSHTHTATAPENKARLDKLIRPDRRITVNKMRAELGAGVSALETISPSLGTAECTHFIHCYPSIGVHRGQLRSLATVYDPRFVISIYLSPLSNRRTHLFTALTSTASVL